MHRDYQNTILAITNSDGLVVEKRLFDAWGSEMEVQDGYNNILAKPKDTRISTPGTGFAGIGGTSGASMIVFGTLAGGAGAALTGGNFWQGAVTGLIVSGLVHLTNNSEQQSDAVEDPTKKVSQSNVNDIAEGDVINLHNSENGALSLWAKQSKPGSDEVEIHSHGSKSSINGMKDVKAIGKLLYEKSPAWRKMVDGGIKIKLKLFSCNTGNGDDSIASQIKAAYPNVTIMEPTNKWVVTYYGFWIFKSVTGGYVQSPGKWKNF